MNSDTTIASIFTLVLGVLCLAVGGVGASLRPFRMAPPPPPNEPPPVEVINVELTDELISETAATQQSPALPLELPGAPPPPQISAPALPQAIPVSAPEAVAFALPVEGPTIEVEVAQAAYSAPQNVPDDNAPVSPAPPAPQQLTYGRGQGRQPKPPYPYQANRLNQTGTVRVRFTVGEDGRVTHAEAVAPCQYPLLNNSAVATIRNRWRFPQGRERLYEVEIRFELKDQ